LRPNVGKAKDERTKLKGMNKWGSKIRERERENPSSLERKEGLTTEGNGGKETLFFSLQDLLSKKLVKKTHAIKSMRGNKGFEWRLNTRNQANLGRKSERASGSWRKVKRDQKI